MTFEQQLKRTIECVELLANGKFLRLEDGQIIAMSDDMLIGYVLNVNGELLMSELSTIDLKQLNDILNQFPLSYFVSNSDTK
jgi:hypothetical protein